MEQQIERPLVDEDTKVDSKRKQKVNLGKVFTDGLFENNPVFVQLVGMCSVLGISSSMQNAIGMGLSVIFVLTMSKAHLGGIQRKRSKKVGNIWDDGQQGPWCIFRGKLLNFDFIQDGVFSHIL